VSAGQNKSFCETLLSLEVTSGVYIAEPSNQRHFATAQVLARYGKRSVRRPRHAVERGKPPWTPSEADQPITAVLCRPEDGVRSPKTLEGLSHMPSVDCRDIAANDDSRPGRDHVE
jgi:hypothetical protein